MNNLYEKKQNSNVITINPYYKEMYYAPKIEEEKALKCNEQIIWTHMWNISVQNTVVQNRVKAKIA